MLVRELVERKTDWNEHEQVLHSGLVIMHAGTGRIMYDYKRNKKERLQEFLDYEILSLWADVDLRNRDTFKPLINPIVKVYVMEN